MMMIIFPGIGYASVVIVQYLNIYYIVILGWAFFYMFHSFQAVLPWSHCGNKWNTAACFAGKKFLSENITINGTFNGTRTFEDNSTVSPIVEFWK